MSGISFPDPGQGGEEPPLPGGLARGEPDDWDGDAEMASYLADIEAGRAAEPGPWESPADSAAYDKLAFAADLDTRLPDTFAGLGNGRLDRYRALLIHRATICLSDEHAAAADQVLAAAAAGLTYQQLRAKAAAVEMKLDPEGVRRRKEEARARRRRVEARREDSGNMAYGGRELSPDEALAAKAVIDADAIALRTAGAEGSLRELRVRAYLARLQGKNPLDEITTGSGGPAAGIQDADEGCRDEDEDEEDEGHPGGFGDRPAGPQGPGTPAGGPAPLPALITLTVSAGTLLGWSPSWRTC